MKCADGCQGHSSVLVDAEALGCWAWPALGRTGKSSELVTCLPYAQPREC